MGKFSHVLTFVGGAAIGSIGTWYFLKKHYEEQTEIQIQSVKEAYNRPIVANAIKTMREELNEIGEAASRGIEEGFASAQNEKSTTILDAIKARGYVPEVPDIPKVNEPEVISPDEFGEYYDYVKVFLTYYADNTLADNEDELLTVDEIEDSCGLECLSHFGEYEDDTVYVRNDVKRCYYEITKDLRNYCELQPTDDD